MMSPLMSYRALEASDKANRYMVLLELELRKLNNEEIAESSVVELKEETASVHGWVFVF
jgi:hypothetical protein